MSKRVEINIQVVVEVEDSEDLDLDYFKTNAKEVLIETLEEEILEQDILGEEFPEIEILSKEVV